MFLALKKLSCKWLAIKGKLVKGVRHERCNMSFLATEWPCMGHVVSIVVCLDSTYNTSLEERVCV